MRLSPSPQLSICPAMISSRTTSSLLNRYTAIADSWLPTFGNRLSVPFQESNPRTLKTEQMVCPETSVQNGQHMMFKSPEERRHLHCGGSLKSCSRNTSNLDGHKTGYQGVLRRVRDIVHETYIHFGPHRRQNLLMFHRSKICLQERKRKYRLDGPGIESRWGEIFVTRPDRPWAPPSLLYNGYRVIPGGKAAGSWR
jgi:hypothetical protein